MAKVVHKYTLSKTDVLELSEPIEVSLPFGAEVLTVGLQVDTLVVWAVVDTVVRWDKTWIFYVVPTGGNVPSDSSYVTTLHVDVAGSALVFHVFKQDPGATDESRS